MPFAKCKHCGRLFHTFEPLLPDSPAAYWPALDRGDAVYEVCPECLRSSGVDATLGPNEASAKIAERIQDDA